MGTVSGDLEVFGIANLLQMLSANGSEGLLAVEREGHEKVIHFSSRGIRLVSAGGHTHPLGEILIRSGRLTKEQVDELLEEQRATRIPLGELVVRFGILPRQLVQNALREQVAEEIYDLFTWEGATFKFTDTPDERAPEGASPLASVVLDANMTSIMIEAARRIDELGRIRSMIPDVRLVPERLELPATLDDPSLDPEAIQEILPLVDGERSVGHIIASSLYPKFTVLRTLFGLAQKGVVKIRYQGDEGPITVLRRPGTSPAEGAVPRGRTVLLVSPLPTFRSGVAMCLRAAGFDVAEAEGLEGPLDLLCKQCVDAVVLDVPLETEDGLAYCRRFREKTPIPSIVLSGNAGRAAIANALQSGARYVLAKPLNEQLLVERLTEILAEAPESARAAGGAAE